MTSRPAPVREADTQKLVLDYLAVKGWWTHRTNTGSFAAPATATTKRRFFRAGRKGMADLLAVRHSGAVAKLSDAYEVHRLIWLEIKSPTGKQSPEQKAFQAEVEAAGMRYAVIRNLEDLEAIIG